MPDAVVRVQSAPQWFPNNVAVPGSSQITQVAGSRPGRNTVVIANTGANTVQIRATADTNGGYITLAAGATMGIDTEAEVFCTCPAAGGTTLETIETVFPITDGGKRPPMPSYFDAVKGAPS